MTAPAPSTLLLRAPRALSDKQVFAYASRLHPTPPVALTDYLRELSRLGHKSGYNFDILAAQSAEETNGWTSRDWTLRNNPAGIGHDDDLPTGAHFANGKDAARAHLVHMSAYCEGRLLPGSPLHPYIGLDPVYQRVFDAKFAGVVRSVADLGNGHWETDPHASQAIAARYAAIAAMPVPRPAPKPPEDVTKLLPPIVWVNGCDNWHPRPDDMKPVAICRHITDDESLENVLGWFKNPSSQASAHFVVSREVDPGTGLAVVYQLVRTSNAAWTNGDYATLVNGVWRLNEWRTDIPWLVDAIESCRAGLHNLNDFTVGIEHIGTPADPPTAAQYASSAALGRYLCDERTYGIGRNRGRNIRHSDIDHIDRAYCPGDRFDLGGVITAQGGDPLDLAA